MTILVPSSCSHSISQPFITWQCTPAWLTGREYCGIQGPRVRCRSRHQILWPGSKELQDLSDKCGKNGKNGTGRIWSSAYSPHYHPVKHTWPHKGTLSRTRNPNWVRTWPLLYLRVLKIEKKHITSCRWVLSFSFFFVLNLDAIWLERMTGKTPNTNCWS